MKKVSGFYLSKHKKTKDLTKQMQLMEVNNQRKKLKKIVSQRKNKWKQVIRSQQLRLPNFNYLKQQSIEFSSIIPNASKQPFINQKQKVKLITSDRAYSSSQNVKVGKIKGFFQNKIDLQDCMIVNKKFMEFDKLIDEQTPILKIKVLQQRDKNIIVDKPNNDIKLKKIFFQNIQTDRFNFYKTNDYHSIEGLSMSRSRTDRQSISNRQSEDYHLQNIQRCKLPKNRFELTKSRYLQFRKQKFLNSTLDSTRQQDGQSQDYVNLNRSRVLKSKQQSLKASITKYNKTKPRIQSNKHKQTTFNFIKNINSVEQY